MTHWIILIVRDKYNHSWTHRYQKLQMIYSLGFQTNRVVLVIQAQTCTSVCDDIMRSSDRNCKCLILFKSLFLLLMHFTHEWHSFIAVRILEYSLVLSKNITTSEGQFRNLSAKGRMLQRLFHVTERLISLLLAVQPTYIEQSLLSSKIRLPSAKGSRIKSDITLLLFETIWYYITRTLQTNMT